MAALTALAIDAKRCSNLCGAHGVFRRTCFSSVGDAPAVGAG